MSKRFEAKVLSTSNQVLMIYVDANDEVEARRFVEGSGDRLIGIRQHSSPKTVLRREKPFNLVVFNQQLYALLEAGQTIVDSIEVLGKNDRRGHYRAVFDSLLHSLHEGFQLSDAMHKLPSAFPALYVAMVKASETTGTVKHAVKRYTEYQAQVDEIRSKLKTAATYPAILLSVGSIVIAFLMLYVLPRFSEIYDDAKSTKVAPGFVQIWGTFVRHNTSLAWSVLFGLLLLILFLLFHPAVRHYIARKIVNMPWIGERIWLLQMARMYRTMGMLIKSGVSVLAAMRMTQASLPEAMRGHLVLAVQEVSEGHPVSKVLMSCGLSTEIAQRLLVAGESSGNLDDMMERVADFYDQENALWIDAAGRIIEPALMVGIGLIIGAIVLMLYSPIFDLANIV